MQRFKVKGWRQGDLRLLGIMWAAIGLTVIASHDVQPDLVYTHFPLWFRIPIWVIPGAVAIVGAYRPRWENLGFGLLYLPVVERALGYLAGWLVYGHEERVGGFVVYALIFALVRRLLRRPEPLLPVTEATPTGAVK